MTKMECTDYALARLNEKLKGKVEEDGIHADYGFRVGLMQRSEEDMGGIIAMEMVFVVWHDDFAEPLIDVVKAQGETQEKAIDVAVSIFYSGAWEGLEQSAKGSFPRRLITRYCGQQYEYKAYERSVVRIGVKKEEVTPLVDLVWAELPKYLGSKKYYWLRVVLEKYQDVKKIDVRINGSVCVDLEKYYEDYVETKMDGSESYVCERQYAIIVREGEDDCPFTCDQVKDASKYLIQLLAKVKTKEEYMDARERLSTYVDGNEILVSDLTTFLPEILNKIILGYDEGDVLCLVQGEGDDKSITELRKTQVRTYFYAQQAVLEYLAENPPQDDVANIIKNCSTLYRRIAEMIQESQKEGKEFDVKTIKIPGIFYFSTAADYKVW